MKENLLLILVTIFIISGNACAGNSDAKKGGGDAMQILSSNMDRHTAVLQKKSGNVAAKVLADVYSAQAIQQKKIALQIKINELRSKQGGVTDISQRKILSQQIYLLEKERAGLYTGNR